MQSQIWDATIPLHITHPSSPVPYLIQVPRLSYLPLLLPRLTSFFGPASSFSYEGILLKNLPVGLLYDLYQPELPWRLTLGDGPLFDIHDTFMNSVKEADFIRNGTAKGIMSMSKEHSTQLWNTVQDNDYASFSRINSILLNPPTPLKHIPLRIYIPSSPSSSNPSSSQPNANFLGSIKIIQTLIPPVTERRETQTLGSALNAVLPSLFPSRRDAILAEPILHGAPVPFRAPLEEVMREAAYADGWIHLGVLMIDA
ncbi:APG5-domain-containing protein [Mollisia scopiformis]|uniref:Autophagy protein 5 n=1 Tax=Mollisia scopiformis TaxID=149040 RepID=A0A194WV87_MOLSC|nr:APG5-domain-containing protein [Mollisia scopiformis]KUJ11881.1 APG5-domain-containing protein [Mollisia scopiformis]